MHKRKNNTKQETSEHLDSCLRTTWKISIHSQKHKQTILFLRKKEGAQIRTPRYVKRVVQNVRLHTNLHQVMLSQVYTSPY